MKIKKTLCILSAITLLMAGCGKTTPIKPTEGELQVQEEGLAFLDVMLGNAYMEEWNENNVVQSVSWDKLKLSENDAKLYPELVNCFDKINDANLDEGNVIMDELISASEGLDGGDYNPLYLTGNKSIYMQRADNKLVSYLEEKEVYSGGMHPESVYKSFNLDPETGKELLITDVITDVDKLPEILSASLCEKYDYVNFGEDQPLTTLSEYSPKDYQWTMDYQGVTIWFSPYDIAAYMVGPLSTKVYFADYPDLFNEEYTKELTEDYVVKVPLGQSFDFDLTEGDGETDEIYIYETADDYGEYNMLSVTVNGLTYVDEMNYAYAFDVYLAHTGGKNYICADSYSDNDYHMISVWDINNGIPEIAYELYGTEIDYEYIEESFEEGWVYKKVFNNPHSVALETRFEILGTRGGVATFGINGKMGKLEMVDEAYTFNYGAEVETLIALEAEVVATEERITIPEGCVLTPYQTDGESYVDLKMETGEVIRLEIDCSQWPVMVNSMPEDECFKDLMYAG